MSQKIILYYKFTPVTDPEMVRKWQTVFVRQQGAQWPNYCGGSRH